MFTVRDVMVANKTIKEVTITDINELRNRIIPYQNIPQSVDTQAMDANYARGTQEVASDVYMGIIGHLIIYDLIHQSGKSCSLHIEESGFYLESEGRRIKIRTSLANTTPCPDKHINAFSILGDRVDAERSQTSDFYMQIVFCDNFDITSSEPITLYILGGLHINNLNNEKEFAKQTVKAGKIRNAQSIDTIIGSL